MADIKAGTKYVLTNSLIGPKNALASTSANDSVIVVPSKSDGSQSWYFLETSTSGYYRLHTEQKGDFAALDVLNYNGKNSLDLHMYAVQENTGQHWRVNKQDDGSVKINNQFTGSDIYLDVVKDTLQPTLAAKDGPGQRWTLSQVGSLQSATSTASIAATATISRSTSASTNNSATITSSTTSPSDTSSSSSGLSKGVVGGIAAGSVVGIIAVAIGAFVLWRSRRNRNRNMTLLQNPPAINSRPMLHVP